jgi:hypothetical protein
LILPKWRFRLLLYYVPVPKCVRLSTVPATLNYRLFLLNVDEVLLIYDEGVMRYCVRTSGLEVEHLLHYINLKSLSLMLKSLGELYFLTNKTTNILMLSERGSLHASRSFDRPYKASCSFINSMPLSCSSNRPSSRIWKPSSSTVSSESSSSPSPEASPELSSSPSPSW